MLFRSGHPPGGRLQADDWHRVEGEVGGCNSALLGMHAASALTGDGSSVDRAASGHRERLPKGKNKS